MQRWELAKDSPGPFFLALGYTGLGERERALEWLETGYSAHDANMRLIWDPAFTPLHNDHRFQELTCKLDLPPGACNR